MAYQKYQSFRFTDESLNMIRTMEGIIQNFVKQGFTLTVRQLYYQLVARDLIENTEQSYKRVTNLANDARLAGLIDWDSIEDRTRAFISRQRWESGNAILRAVARTFHMDMWMDQRTRPFVIIEKEALVGVLTGTCGTYDVPILAARGYPSSTVLHEFAVQEIQPWANQGQCIRIIHLGDHDPSGLDMTRDLQERIELFSESSALGYSVELVRVALNMDQIKRRKPPANPAKVTDSRFAEYQREFGDESWELDALPPEFLNELVKDEITACIDDSKKWRKQERLIKRTRTKLNKVAKEFKA